MMRAPWVPSIALATACAALAGFAGTPAPAPIVIQWQPSGAPADVAQGVQMGVRESRQTAGLLNRTVAVDARAAHPFVSIRADASGVSLAGATCSFRVLPSAEERAAALARWTQSSGRHGTFRVAAWDPSLERYGAGDVNKRYTTEFHAPMTEGAWAGWAAVKASVEAALRSDSADGCAAIANIRFDAHKGAMLSFVHGVLQQPLYVIEHTASGDRVAAELPPS